MPRRRSPKTLQKYCMLSLVNNWDMICYSAQSPREMSSMLETDTYLKFEGPFADFPSTILEEVLETVRTTRSLTRKFLHLLMREQLTKLDLSFGIGEIFYGLEFLSRCKKLRDLSLSYLNHLESSQILPIIPFLTSVVSLNLQMTSVNDKVSHVLYYYFRFIQIRSTWDLLRFNPLACALENVNHCKSQMRVLTKIGECCPNLHELNLTSTNISDQGLISLCGSDGSVKKCQKLQRLIITETGTSWVGAYHVLQNMPNLTDFDFDKVFQVFEHLDPNWLKTCSSPLKLRSLYSTAPCIRPDSIDSAVVFCPKAEIVSIMNSWIDNETFYKFMQFENLRTLTLFRTEGQVLDFDEGILPVLQVVGPNLENLILTKFIEIDLVSLGRSCPRLRKMALSGTESYKTDPHGPVPGLFTLVSVLELWLDEDTEFTSTDTILQLLHSAKSIESLLVKQCDAFEIAVLKTIWKTNPMESLSRLTLDHCNGMTKEVLEEFLRMENDLTTLRLWSCYLIKRADKTQLADFIKFWNLDLYLEWYE